MAEKSTIYTTDPAKVESAVRNFSAGDTIAIALPGGGYGIAIIGRLTPERMFCTTFGPRVDNFPDSATLANWKPEGWSRWVADTLGLRDGSWIKIERPRGMSDADHIDLQRLPRFKFTTKTGKMQLAVYDPETLFVNEIVESPNPEEFERAPSFIPQDATTFEVAVSRNLDSACDLPDPETVKVLNEERFVVAMLRERMTGTTDTLVFDHVLTFKKKAEAERAQRELSERGLNVSEPLKAGWLGPTTLEVHISAVASYPVVRQDVKRVREIARLLGGKYDGFGAAAL